MNRNINSEKDILLIGAGGHAKVIIDALRSNKQSFNIIGIVDKNESKLGKNILGVTVLGSDDILRELYGYGLRKVFISLGMIKDFRIRENIYTMLKDIKFECINIFHNKSIISDWAVLGEGNAVLAGAIINAEAKIGNNCIINSGSIIEHECIIGNNVHIAPGACVSGQSIIENNCMVGAGSTIIQGIRIGANAIIGAGSVVIRDIPPNSIAVGVPAKVIKAG